MLVHKEVVGCPPNVKTYKDEAPKAGQTHYKFAPSYRTGKPSPKAADSYREKHNISQSYNKHSRKRRYVNLQIGRVRGCIKQPRGARCDP